MSTSGNNNNNNEDQNPSRKGKGRRKVVMEKVENPANLQVTFSKRRNGLFKKTSELSTRCGAETAVIIFSPGGKPYTFGHPDVETVTDRFLADQENDHVHDEDRNFPPTPDQLLALETERQMVANSAARLNHAMEQLDLAKKHEKELDQMGKRAGIKTKQIAEYSSYQELDQLKDNFLFFKNKLETHEEAKAKSFTVTPYEFLGPSLNVGTAIDYPVGEPSVVPAAAACFEYPPVLGFDNPHGLNIPNQFINIFGNNVPLASYHDPHLAAADTSSTVNNFLDVAPQASYMIPMWNDNSSFVIPYTPLGTDHSTAMLPIDPAEEHEWISGRVTAGNKAGGARKDIDE
ncbi:uncharacterized protein [Henckelia pumila]|uniref:uncharacterized protein n=1 Tax=Henckelia pumila TaxID=405737 RepID=UPI003C6E633D